MHRALWLVLSLVIAGCCNLPEEHLPLQPIPDNGKALDYAEVVLRARLQAASATEAFYVNKWSDLEDAATSLERTAALLPKATGVPDKQKDKLAAHADELTRDARQLRESAKAKDVPHSNEYLQRIHLKVRELRPEG